MKKIQMCNINDNALFNMPKTCFQKQDTSQSQTKGKSVITVVWASDFNKMDCIPSLVNDPLDNVWKKLKDVTSHMSSRIGYR